MESVIRGLVVYAILLVVFRISGKRTLAQVSSFELVLLLIISETTQEAMIGQDRSVTNAVLLITTLIGTSIVLSYVKHYWKRAAHWLDGIPFTIIHDGQVLKERMDKERVDEEDVLAAARRAHGIEKLEDIHRATLENDGHVSVIPRKPQN